jgi:valyl-tRNA synthetase
LKTIGLIIVLLVFTRLAFVVGDEINDIPILGTFFQMLGLGYTTWFVAENLVMAKARQKLWGVWFKPTTESNMRVIESPQPQDTASAIAGVVGTVQVLLSLTGVVDIEALSGKIQKRLSKIEGEINSLTTRLNNPKFVDKAAEAVVQATRDALAEVEKQAEILRDRLRSLA